jgi:hypothetical protein
MMHVMNRFCMRACAVATAGVALGMWGVTAASASGGSATIGSGTPGPAGIAASRGGALRLTINNHAFGPNTAAVTSTRTFAGYQAAVPAGSATVMTGSFAVPTLSCTTAERVIAPSAGVLVNNNRSASASFVFTGCVNGTAVFFPGLVVNGKETDFQSSPFAAGDVIDLTTKVSTNRTRVQVTDVTTGVTQKITTGPGARAGAAFFGDEAAISNSGALLHVPDFGKLKFRDCIIDGKDLAKWRPHAFQRVNSRGTVQIAIGTLSTSGLAFATRFEHS